MRLTQPANSARGSSDGTPTPRSAAVSPGERSTDPDGAKSPGAAFGDSHPGRQSLKDRTVAESARAELRRASYMGCWVWGAFTLLDVYMAGFLYPATPSWHFLAMRAFDELLFIVAYLLSLRPNLPVKWLRAVWLSGIQFCALFISLMAIDFGGLNSVYMHGLSVAMMVIAIVMPARWQTALLTLAPVALTFPGVMAAAAWFSPSVRSAWLDRYSLLTFFSQYAFVLAIALVGSISSHLVWAAHRQVYQARRLGRYRLEAPIGEGGMNQVWLAWDTTLRRNVALKILQAGSSPNAHAVRRFEREAMAASKLADPHTIRIFDFGASDDGVYFIAMEYLRGADLAALVAGHGPMPPARMVHFALQACASLAEAHDAGIVHRDVKPHNLFVTQVGDQPDFLKLLDFGIARQLQAEPDGSLTQTGMPSGTPAFMAPEVCRGERSDIRSDLYSLGATLYFLLAGSPPFVGPSTGHVISAHLLQEPEPPSARRGEPLPEALEQVVLRCLAKEPRDRFQTARDLAGALAPLANALPWTSEDATRFWQSERTAKVGRWTAPTSDSVEVAKIDPGDPWER